MRKIYVVYGWTPESGEYVSGIYSSKLKAERYKSDMEKANRDKTRIYTIETEILR